MKTGGGSRAEREISHGRKLAARNPALQWGWDTPAGRIRAERRAALIAGGAGLAKGVHVLEIGCGTGIFTEKFINYGATLVAVEISADLLEIARQRNLPPERVTFVGKSFEEAGGKRAFDAVIASSVLHHLDLETALPRIYELLKPGGRLCFAEPNMLNPQVFLERAFRFLPAFDYVSPDETAFVRWRLAKRLAKAGFSEVDISPFDWLHPGTHPRIISRLSALGVCLEKTPLVRELAGSLLIKASRPRETGHGAS